MIELPMKSISTIRSAALAIILSATLILSTAQPVFAVPILQLYLEGAEYNEQTESWELSPVGSSSGAPFRLWVIGNVDGPGGKGTVFDVRLAIAYDEADLGLEIDLQSTTSDGFGGFSDATLPIAPVQGIADIRTDKGLLDTSSTGTGTDGVVNDGSIPALSNGRALPSHGEYGPGVVWEEFRLGDFSSTEDSIGDFIGSFPTDITHDAGQINVYEVRVSGGSGATLHFDAYDSIQGKNKARAVFAPFSHDGVAEGGSDADANIIPEPSSLLIYGGLLLCGIAMLAWRRRRSQTARPA